MKRIGILTFHYSNNYGAVLQALALQKTLEAQGFNVEIINHVPAKYRSIGIFENLGLSRKNTKTPIKRKDIIKTINIMLRNSRAITNKFDDFRKTTMKLSNQVDESTLEFILNDYDIIIVGSDQVWNPSQRKRPEYFLDYENKINGKKISYAADSTVKEIKTKDMEKLKRSLDDFEVISVRNKHSFEFVKAITNKEPSLVADPTILYDFENIKTKKEDRQDYILTYVLGEEIVGTHIKALEKIKKVYGNLPIYSIKIPTIKFEVPNYSDRVFYNLGPKEWLSMFENAKFIYTDSFHGVLFSLKFNKPFLAYYTEVLRATRFIDIGERYNIEKYIVKSVEEIDEKASIELAPDFLKTKALLKKHKEDSLKFIMNTLTSL